MTIEINLSSEKAKRLLYFLQKKYGGESTKLKNYIQLFLLDFVAQEAQKESAESLRLAELDVDQELPETDNYNIRLGR